MKALVHTLTLSEKEREPTPHTSPLPHRLCHQPSLLVILFLFDFFSGSCFVKRFKTDRSSRPAHLDHTLELFPGGAPCQSSLFTSRDMSSIVSRSPEVEIAVCQLKCPGKSEPFNSIFFFYCGPLLHNVSVARLSYILCYYIISHLQLRIAVV